MIVKSWPAPAKLNRFLHIIGRRADGYHLLQTVFQFIEYCDYLNFKVGSDKTIYREGQVPGVSPDDDLTVQAAHLLQQTTGVTRGVTIHIDKRIPLGGGLGGGSSDAATTLVALNHYWQTGLSLPELAALGLQLGADVPVFVHGYAAWAEGVGEQLTPIELEESWFLVLVPSCTVVTRAIFTDPDLTRNSQPIKISDFLTGAGGNDCEPVVYRRYPEVAAAAKWLSDHGKPCLTGTGACVFAAFPDRQAAQRVKAQLPKSWSGFVARGLNRSPLRDRLSEELEEVGMTSSITT